LSIRRKEAVWGYIFISPWIVGLVVFTLGPLLAVFYFSLTRYDLYSPPRWIGLSNFFKAFSGEDELFYKALYNTLYFVVINVPASLVLGFILALLVNRSLFGRNIFRAIFYAPAVIPLVAACTIWSTLYAPEIGLINYVLGLIGIPGPNWFASRFWSKPAIVIMGTWNVGEVMIIFLAGLKSIPDQLYEAARLDGAKGFKSLWFITIPMMTPTILFNFIMRMIKAFQVFQTAYVLTGGGPLNSTRFLALHLYKNAFETFYMGYASALGVVLFAVVLIFAIFVLRWSERWVYYAGGK
jgi:multiple sugar transport system permease protein